MITNLTPKDLIEFEENIANRFDDKYIPGPIHLHHGNEQVLIDIFKDIREEDYIFSTWRSHYHCLLKGVPKHILTAEIFAGHSITLNFPEYRIVSSAIVGNIFALALGTALSIKLNKGKEQVYCFAGDMSFENDSFCGCYKYSINFDLPVIWVCECNNKSVCTPTYESWGQSRCSYLPDYPQNIKYKRDLAKKFIYYEYESKYQHSGTLIRTQF